MASARDILVVGRYEGNDHFALVVATLDEVAATTRQTSPHAASIREVHP